MTGIPRNCAPVRDMTPHEAARVLAKLAEMSHLGPLRVGRWDGTLFDTANGSMSGPEHVAVFNGDSLVAPFGPRGETRAEACAVLFATAMRYASGIALAMPAAPHARGPLRPVCQRIIDGYAAGHACLDTAMLQHLVALGDCAAEIQATEQRALQAVEALQAMLIAFSTEESRNADRWPAQARALEEAHRVVGLPLAPTGSLLGAEMDLRL